MNNKKTAIAIALATTVLSSCSNNASPEVESVKQLTEQDIVQENVHEVEYEIYPNPQYIEYHQSSFLFKRDVNLVVENDVDQYTKRKIIDALTSKRLRIHSHTDISNDGYPSILIGIYHSGGVVDRYLNNQDLSFIENKIDAYYLDINEQQITILGKDTDACYYALSTLELIFNQSNHTLRTLTIKDYSDSKYRGFIEGFYGIPWTSDERIELMKFGSKFKSNIYIYAPKDDSYHSANWRGLYIENDLELLKKQIETGRETKTRLAWSIHPFMNQPITNDNYDEGKQLLLAKFEQVYNAGVRQFVISADDVSTGSLSFEQFGALHCRLLNDAVAWCNSKKDCYPLIFVPSAYCTSSEETLKINMAEYYQGLMNGLDDSVEIMWTGTHVTSKVSTGDFDIFENLTNGRKAFMWLNWPVNDYLTKRLLLGKAEVLDVSYENEEMAFSGIVTNPMSQAEASKLSIFAIADYAWNTKKFDVNKSYKDSFKYIEENETESFYAIAQHLTNTSKYEGSYFDESWDLNRLINNYDIERKQGKNVTARLDALIKYYDDLIDHCQSFINNASNRKLVENIKPWVEMIEDISICTKAYLNIVKNADTLSSEEVKEKMQQVEDVYERINTHQAPVLDSAKNQTVFQTIEGGVVVLMPFLNRMRQEAKMLSGDVLISYEGFTSIYQGTLDMIADQKDDTYCWFGSVPTYQAYVRLDFRKEIEIRDIRVLFGHTSDTDYMNGVIRYSNDGQNFVTIQELEGILTVVDLSDNPIRARYLEILNTDKQASQWVSIKDFSVNNIPEDQVKITYNAGEADEGLPLVSASEHPLSHMIDNDESTYTWFDWHSPQDSYIILDYRQEQTVNNIYITQGVEKHPDDYFRNVSFYYSLDGITYTLIGEEAYINQKDIFIDLSSQPIKAQYIKIVSNEYAQFGVTIKEFGINKTQA